MRELIISVLKKLRFYPAAKRLKDEILRVISDDSMERKKMLSFYSKFLKSGDLCFDIGASIGERSKIFLDLGCHVVLVEPQTRCINIINKKFRNNKNVSIIHAGIGEKEEVKTLNICTSSAFSTFSDKQMMTVKRSKSTQNMEWNESEEVQITTIDNLIKKFGLPKFCKIDVEGYEKNALKGLSHPIKIISFEYNPLLKNNSSDCVKILSKLGKYKFNYSQKESMVFSLDKWVDSKRIIDILMSMPDEFSFGDVYAVLKN